jgi:hypothetical protein
LGPIRDKAVEAIGTLLITPRALLPIFLRVSRNPLPL